MKIFVAVALSLVLADLVTAPAQSIENPTIEREEYAVYSATISQMFTNEQGTRFVIANPTGSPFFTSLKEKKIPFAIAGAPRVSNETFADFLQRNKTNRWLARKLNLDVDYALVDFREIKKLLHDFDGRDDWTDFGRAYPGARGFIHLSRVGFNSRLDEALVFASWTCGNLCGKGEFILFSKKDNVWKIVNRALYVVS